ncbi:2-oxoglutarate dehydrogenase complex dihydrolipoyllysine-residue succinyltransferase [Rickettsiales endosymbiont of Trichoplax sp. H2]|uniref:2-oxoglutarate dehydrogenase complex dihydrolipoyllysine-residue succinyltransferase n=1 Tax=Rickettsiales endosymbiont of Trichoplax sp. H2 TaxID=2021221 RepID=UPI0012B3F0E4|nr:2-oxoglutarate dehydrogenase complex dihydrolipoyllysine-residue succinyltransferase [Rickettsiales endosymbiont of Trichoplax sp. H2]MSO14310.1 Dihydrolipoyllysine-residue succinyltransferase component of 2-oxoglutarate dehydrogenase complex [Rickettsiales endosymbiont of Trichoplax sp. H2]
MAVNIIVPSLGESVTEATIAKWHKKVGEQIRVDELLIELETDKITLEVNAPASGTISEIKFNEGDVVAVGDTLGLLEEGEVSQEVVKNDDESESDNINTNIDSQPVQNDVPKEQIFSPAASKIASENNIQNIENPTGKDGRVTKGDVISAISNPQSQNQTSIVTQSQDQLEERVKMTRLRKTIAKRLKDSQNTAAILSTFNEVDMSAVIKCRKNYQEAFKEKHGVKLGFMSFFVKAVVAALKEIPAVNAEIDGDYLVYKNYYNIGVAVGTEQGLVVPVVKNADKMSHAEIEKNIVSLGKKARDGKLAMSDMQGGTFSITNGGIYGSLLSTPIINPPQSGILGMHNIVERPMAISGDVVIRPMMYIALSYDHRIIDGSEAVTFLRRVKEMVETPEKLLFNL